ncbi:MAG: CRTAC1 family protein [Gammaproteobacteria bacterium]|nr:CRTAC1 family protein [Gammaproteobacteria bacterium]
MTSPDRVSSRHANWPTGILIACGFLLGCEGSAPPDEEPAQTLNGDPWFEERSQQAGLDFTQRSGQRGQFLFPEITCGGAALFDMDADADLDVYFVQSGRFADDPADRPPNQLFRNRGDGTFEEVTDGSGADDRGYGMGVATGDYDNDGDVDLYITNVGPNVLLRNDGKGRFADVTGHAGVGHPGWGTSAVFLDYDADGDLDLFVVNYIYWSINVERDCFTPAGMRDYCDPKVYEAPAEDVLYRNNGDGTFTDVSAEAGITTAYGNGLGVVSGDFNGDHLVDVFVANDGMLNQLWINQGNGHFHDGAMLSGCALDQNGIAKAGMGVAANDVDDDSDLDLLVVNLYNESDSFYRNAGEYFVDDTATVGLGTVTRTFTRFGTALLDLDNDGRLDIYEANGRVRGQSSLHSDDPFAEPNMLLYGTASGGFEEVRPRGGTASPLVATSRAAAFGDIDNDGGIDILVVNRDGPAHLLRNIVDRRGLWIMFRVLDEHARDALGATVTLQVGERTITRDVRTAYSYLAANDPRIHVGLGDHTGAEDVTVRWVNGPVERFGRYDADQVVTLRHGSGMRVGE